jgi:SCP-2 sterol transfer family
MKKNAKIISFKVVSRGGAGTHKGTGWDLVKMARGEINRPQAFMEGLYTVEGDMALLTRMGDLFKPPKAGGKELR